MRSEPDLMGLSKGGDEATGQIPLVFSVTDVPTDEPFRYCPIRVEVEGGAHCANIPGNFRYITDALNKTFALNCSLKLAYFMVFSAA